MSKRPPWYCTNCDASTDHRHLIDEAHGVSGTYMNGSERFVCSVCNHVTRASDGPTDLPFIYEKVAPLAAGKSGNG